MLREFLIAYDQTGNTQPQQCISCHGDTTTKHQDNGKLKQLSDNFQDIFRCIPESMLHAFVVYTIYTLKPKFHVCSSLIYAALCKKEKKNICDTTHILHAVYECQ